ncbi:GTP-binding protein [Bradyrhizobium niftali]|uniref:GTP-binding protein n=1 Tax=Bradyrhizobium niftali TaxID=2560055 RepID=A0A4Y9LZH8_9BRAD|nr:GTP-binding protein [Bradyrhizobium niftali]
MNHAPIAQEAQPPAPAAHARPAKSCERPADNRVLIEGGSQRAWKKNEAPQSRLVFIGRDLPVDLLRQGFAACSA